MRDERHKNTPDRLPIVPAISSDTSHSLACVRIPGAADLSRLFRACTALTPQIEHHPERLLLDLTGCERLLLGRKAAPSGNTQAAVGEAIHWQWLAERLYRLLADADSGTTDGTAPLQVALAPSRTVAWLAVSPAARSVCAVTPAEVAPFLRPLPVHLLLTLPDLADRPDAALAVAALAQGGIETVGQLARLSPLLLRRRFGPLGASLTRLAAGQDLTPLRISPPAEWLGARIQLDPPATVERLLGALDRLAAFLAQTLRRRRLEADAVALVVQAEACLPWRTTRRLGHATDSHVALFNHAQRLLERIRAEQDLITDGAPQAPVSALSLRVGGLQPARPRQAAFWPQAPHRGYIVQEVAQRLAARCGLGRDGRARLWRAVMATPHAVLPEERYRLEARRAS